MIFTSYRTEVQADYSDTAKRTASSMLRDFALCRGLRVCVAGGLEQRSLDFVFEGVELGIRGVTVRSE